MVMDGSKPTFFLSTSSAARSSVHELRHRGAVARRLLGIFAIEDKDPTMERSRLVDDVFREVGIVGDQRSGQGTLAASDLINEIIDAFEADQRAHGSERLDTMWRIS
jgi:hypothetical protein